jgi:hypothetical protein
VALLSIVKTVAACKTNKAHCDKRTLTSCNSFLPPHTWNHKLLPNQCIISNKWPNMAGKRLSWHNGCDDIHQSSKALPKGTKEEHCGWWTDNFLLPFLFLVYTWVMHGLLVKGWSLCHDKHQLLHYKTGGGTFLSMTDWHEHVGQMPLHKCYPVTWTNILVRVLYKYSFHTWDFFIFMSLMNTG